MQIFVSNNIRMRGLTTPLRAAITAALTLDNPEYIERVKKKRPTWGIDKKLKLYIDQMNELIAPRGFLEDLKTILQQYKINPQAVITIDQVEGREVFLGPWNEKYKLRDDQKPFVEALLKQNGIGVAPAGSGKTIMGMCYILMKGRPTLWLTHTKDLMYQTKERAESTLLGVGKIGLLGDGITEWGDGKLIIAMVQTLRSNPGLIEALKPIIGTVVTDECHHVPSPMFVEVVGLFPAKNMVGLTATPDRKDRLERFMYAGIGPKLYTINRANLYETGRLIKPEIRFVYTDFNYEQASMRFDNDSVDAGGEDLDYNDLLKHLIYDEKRLKLVADNIAYQALLGPAIVITESVRYCFMLQELVNKKIASLYPDEKFRTAVVHGGISRYTWRVARDERTAMYMVANEKAKSAKYDEKARRWKVQIEPYTQQEFEDWQVTGSQRKEILKRVVDKEIHILFATQLAREGLDIPHLAVGHMAMPKKGDAVDSKNGAALEQEIGRIMRYDPNNPDKKAVWFDYVDYQVGVFQAQYYSRRRVYKRLGLIVPAKPKTDREIIDKFLGDIKF